MNAICIFKDLVSENFQVVASHYFRLFDPLVGDDEKIIIDFIKTDVFLNSDAGERADTRLNGWNNFPFKLHLLGKDDFLQLSRMQLYKYFARDWGEKYQEDKEKIIYDSHVNCVKQDIERCSSDCFFLIDLSWFDKGGNRVAEDLNQFQGLDFSMLFEIPDSSIVNDWASIYGYYALVIWLDRKNSMVTACEFLHD